MFMNNLKKLSLVLSPLLLSSCVNQQSITQKKLAPVTNPCQKISMLINAYEDGFEQVKMTKVKARVSNTWKAKYNIIGENCHIWTLGSSKTIYSCNITAGDKASAETFYHNAQQTIQQCLGDGSIMTEAPIAKSEGRKSIFTVPNKQVSLSTHIVPQNAYGDKWTIYYYIGTPN